MIPPSCLLSPWNPGRPVDARWQRVIDLVDCGLNATGKYDDRWVRRGLTYLTSLRKCRSAADRQRLADQMPAVDAAYRLFATSDRFARGVLEAHMLARLAYADVAKACNLSLDAVNAYDALFFQVLGRTDARDFVLCDAIGEKIWNGQLREADQDILMKLYAFLKGPVLLEYLIRYFRGGWMIPLQLNLVSRDQLAEFLTMLRVRALIISRVEPFPQCFRRTRTINKVVAELDDRLRIWDREDLVRRNISQLFSEPCSIRSPKQLAVSSERENWWQAWRAAAVAA